MISDPAEFNNKTLCQISPDYVFIPHWSFKISAEITENFECVMFHMTDLPYGRGGSPLQNLIVRGFKETKLSAFRCDSNIDAGPIYGKLPLSLEGSARDIFERADQLVYQLIVHIIQNSIQPTEQVGVVTEFKRRTPEQGDLSVLSSISEVYDYIRMLDAAGYPSAFLNTSNFSLSFTDAELVSLEDGTQQVRAKVTFSEKPER